MKACVKCGSIIKDGLKFCTNCGAPAPLDKKVCKECGTTIKGEMRFCVNCGAEYRQDPAQQRQQSIQKSHHNENNMTQHKRDIPNQHIQITTQQYNSQAIPNQNNQQTREVNTNTSRKKKNKTPIYIGAVALLLVIAIVIVFVIQPFGVSKQLFNSNILDNIKEKVSLSEGSVNQEIQRKNPTLLIQQELSNEQTEIKIDNLSMQIDVGGLAQPASASITKYDRQKISKAITLDLYDFSIDTTDDILGTITIKIPYDEKLIPQGYTPEECIKAVHHIEETDTWTNDEFIINTDEKIVEIFTYHLSNEGLAYTNPDKVNLFEFAPDIGDNPNVIKSGTADLSQQQVFRNDSWQGAPNFGVFYAQDIVGLFDIVTDCDEEMALAYFINNISDLETIQKAMTPSTNENISLGLNILGLGEGYAEQTLTLAENIGQIQSLGKLTGVLGKLGVGVACFQALSDMYSGKPASETIWNVLKSYAYYKGAIVGGPVGACALAGLFFIEQFYAPIEEWFDLIKTSEHQRLVGAYHDYYNNSKDANGKSIKRDIYDWGKIVSKCNEEVQTSLPQGVEPRDYLNQLLDKEIEEYTHLFWNLDNATKASFLEKTKRGGLYGNLDTIHYYGLGSDTLYDYKLKIMKNDIKGLNLDISDFGNLQNIQTDNLNAGNMISESDNAKKAIAYAEKCSNNERLITETTREFKKEIMESCVIPAQRMLLNQAYLQQKDNCERLVRESMEAFNQIITIDFLDSSIEEGEESIYANCVVVPDFPNIENYQEWVVDLDKNGSGTALFSGLEYARNGLFTDYKVYKEKGDIGVNDPILSKSFTINKDAQAEIDLARMPTLDDLVGTWDNHANKFTLLACDAPWGEIQSKADAISASIDEELGCESEDVEQAAATYQAEIEPLIGSSQQLVFTIEKLDDVTGKMTFQSFPNDTQGSCENVTGLTFKFGYQNGVFEIDYNSLINYLQGLTGESPEEMEVYGDITSAGGHMTAKFATDNNGNQVIIIDGNIDYHIDLYLVEGNAYLNYGIHGEK